MRVDSRTTLRALAFGLACATAALAGVEPPPPVAACAAAPRPCIEARRGKLKLDLTKRRFAWQWAARNVVALRDIESPTIGHAGYDLCLYDASGMVVMASGVPSGELCNGRPCWQARAWGYQYRDAGARSFGLTKITLKVAAGRNDKLSVAGQGALLPLPAAAPTAPLTGQLVRSDDPTRCWTATRR
ncbi:MAG: hypothetical protein ACREQL_09940 [Candidatus Binatia bacterium]